MQTLLQCCDYPGLSEFKPMTGTLGDSLGTYSRVYTVNILDATSCIAISILVDITPMLGRVARVLLVKRRAGAS